MNVRVLIVLTELASVAFILSSCNPGNRKGEPISLAAKVCGVYVCDDKGIVRPANRTCNEALQIELVFENVSDIPQRFYPVTWNSMGTLSINWKNQKGETIPPEERLAEGVATDLRWIMLEPGDIYQRYTPGWNYGSQFSSKPAGEYEVHVSYGYGLPQGEVHTLISDTFKIRLGPIESGRRCVVVRNRGDRKWHEVPEKKWVDDMTNVAGECERIRAKRELLEEQGVDFRGVREHIKR